MSEVTTDYTGQYMAYQQRYRRTLRESDRILIDMVRKAGGTRVLDVGCSTGNLLLHLKHALPEMDLLGVDLFSTVVDSCTNDPELRGIRFVAADARQGLPAEELDVVIASASLFFNLDRADLRSALRHVAAATRPGGYLLGFDMIHSEADSQDLTISERSNEHPDGMTFYIWSEKTARNLLEEAGFADIRVNPFSMPFDLPRPPNSATTTHTVPTAEGWRMSFRGCVYEPWSHFSARRA